MRFWSVLPVCLFPYILFAMPFQADSTVSLNSNDLTRVSDIESFWNMAQLGGGIGYVIIAVLAVGLFLIFLKSIELFIDKRHSGAIRKAVFAGLSIPEIRKLANENNDSILSEVVLHLLNFFGAAKSVNPLQQELATLIDQQIEKFEAFRNRLHFLSDSAGALGLLGTVWGVFLTFFGGNLDSEKILSGMGVALITTLLGLVVSLVINLFATEIYSVFNRRLDMVTKKADELRLYLAGLEGGSVAAIPQGNEKRTSQVTNAETDDELLVKLVPRVEHLRAGEQVRNAVKLSVFDQNGYAAANQTVILETRGPALFKGDLRTVKVTTDKQGEARMTLIAGERSGQAALQFWLAGRKDGVLTHNIPVLPNTAERIKICGGNDQAGEAGSHLPEALRVKVCDRYNNPIPNEPVLFKLTLGEGKFTDGNHEFSIRTDENGEAGTELTLGDQSGFLTVTASVKNGKNRDAEFRILCQS